MPTVYENNVKRKYEQLEQKARADVLIRQLGVRFGDLPAETVDRIRAGIPFGLKRPPRSSAPRLDRGSRAVCRENPCSGSDRYHA